MFTCKIILQKSQLLPFSQAIMDRMQLSCKQTRASIQIVRYHARERVSCNRYRSLRYTIIMTCITFPRKVEYSATWNSGQQERRDFETSTTTWDLLKGGNWMVACFELSSACVRKCGLNTYELYYSIEIVFDTVSKM